MYNIYENNIDKGLDLGLFNKRMIDICNEHRRQNRAMAFAFILYDFENPQVFKILNDMEYWIALNKISGKYLTIFSLNYQLPQKDSTLHGLVPIPIMVSPSVATNGLIRKYFGSDLVVTYPAILFFQVSHDSVVDSLLVTLVEEHIESAFLELKDYIKRAVESLERIHPENKWNIKEIFDALDREVRSARNMRKLKRVVKGAGGIAELISLVKGLF